MVSPASAPKPPLAVGKPASSAISIEKYPTVRSVCIDIALVLTLTRMPAVIQYKIRIPEPRGVACAYCWSADFSRLWVTGDPGGPPVGGSILSRLKYALRPRPWDL